MRPAKTQISLGICPVWSESLLYAHWVAEDPSFLHADSEDSDQTGRMPRLIWVFAGRTLTLLVLSCRGSNTVHRSRYDHYSVFSNGRLFLFSLYRKNLKHSDIQKRCCNHPKIWKTRLYHRRMLPKDADGIANSVDPGQTAAWSGSALFAQAYMSEN